MDRFKEVAKNLKYGDWAFLSAVAQAPLILYWTVKYRSAFCDLMVNKARDTKVNTFLKLSLCALGIPFFGVLAVASIVGLAISPFFPYSILFTAFGLLPNACIAILYDHFVRG